MSRLDEALMHDAGVILETLPLSDKEINGLLDEWCQYDFEEGRAVRALAKLQRLAHDYLLKRSGQYDEYRRGHTKRKTFVDYLRVDSEE